MKTFVARQPIFDRWQRVYAYELLFRSGPESVLANVDAEHGDQASSKVIMTSLMSLDLETLVSDKKAFINVTRNLLLEGLVRVLPRRQTVIELLETIEPDEEVVQVCHSLKRAGYHIALDDFQFTPAMEPLIETAEIIKVDFLESTPEERQQYVDYFAPRGIRLLAEKVETQEEFQEAYQMGYSYFQGYFFCMPQFVSATDLPAYQTSYLKLLKELNQAEVDFDTLEDIVKHEFSLSYRLLRYINSVAMGLRAEVKSLKQAMALLGERLLRKWAILIALSGMSKEKPPELVVLSLVRARFCELVGEKTRMDDFELELFLVGLFSTIDALVDQPLEEILDRIAVPELVSSTLLGDETPLSGSYALALAYERGDWEHVTYLAKEVGLSDAQTREIYESAISWADETFAIEVGSPVEEPGG